MGEKVVILGGGVGGMTAAHELADRGFAVEVLERREIPGGKARSVLVPDTGIGHRADLPGEHGFRFFPGFYRHVTDTMSRIPCDPSSGCGRDHTVIDHLCNTTQMQVARRSGRPVNFDFDPPDVPGGGIWNSFQFLFDYATKLNLHPDMIAVFVGKLLEVVTRSDQWYGKFEETSWLDFSGAKTRFKGQKSYQRYLAGGISRTMVAARANEISARTAACTTVKLMQSIGRPTGEADRVLDGPTNQVWLDPWLADLRAKGVDYRTRNGVTKIDVAGGRITGVEVETPSGHRHVEADYYICALPLEAMKDERFSLPLREADDAFAKLSRLQTRWMNGIQFYLRKDVPQIHGHTIYVDSPWALTSISQGQFWREGCGGMGDGCVDGILSVDISDWLEGRSNKKVASKSTKKEIRDQVVKQLQSHLDEDAAQQLEDENIVGYFLDDAITFPNPTEVCNGEPLLINTKGSWANRPTAATKVPNLFLASDYVQNTTDLTTMEGANEAAREAVNEILRREGRDDLCETWRWRPPFSAPARLVGRAASFVHGILTFDVPFIGGTDADGGPAQPGARLADRVIGSEMPPDEDAVPETLLTASEFEGFARELYSAPQSTLEAYHQRLEQLGSRPEVVEAGVAGAPVPS